MHCQAVAMTIGESRQQMAVMIKSPTVSGEQSHRSSAVNEEPKHMPPRSSRINEMTSGGLMKILRRAGHLELTGDDETFRSTLLNFYVKLAGFPLSRSRWPDSCLYRTFKCRLFFHWRSSDSLFRSLFISAMVEEKCCDMVAPLLFSINAPGLFSFHESRFLRNISVLSKE
jgi:hypothetical protein